MPIWVLYKSDYKPKECSRISSFETPALVIGSLLLAFGDGNLEYFADEFLEPVEYAFCAGKDYFDLAQKEVDCLDKLLAKAFANWQTECEAQPNLINRTFEIGNGKIIIRDEQCAGELLQYIAKNILK